MEATAAAKDKAARGWTARRPFGWRKVGTIATVATIFSAGWLFGSILTCKGRISQLREDHLYAGIEERAELEKATLDRIEKARQEWVTASGSRSGVVSQTSEITCSIQDGRCHGEYAQSLPTPAVLGFTYLRDSASCAEARFRIYLGSREARKITVPCPSDEYPESDYVLLSPVDAQSTETSSFRIVLDSRVTEGFPATRLRTGKSGWAANVVIARYGPGARLGEVLHAN